MSKNIPRDTWSFNVSLWMLQLLYNADMVDSEEPSARGP